jgi:molybdopterin molybdotransferase
MVSVREASDIIFSNLYKPRIEIAPLQGSVNRVLGEKIIADRDFPPFDRVAMDGIAIQFQKFKSGQKDFPVEFTQAAGHPLKELQNPTNCVEVMTGAVLPQGTDTVVRYEDLEIKDNVAHVVGQTIEERQNVSRKGIDCKKGDVLLEPGMLISPSEVALLASVGKSVVKVFALPSTAIISSGDELVGVGEVPLQHQIRRSNTFALEAGMQSVKWEAKHFHFPDDKSVLLKSLERVLRDHDLLILSGGVSKGKFDFIPEVFEDLGVKKLVHHVNQRPGKPFWFGTSKDGKTVFALPGNPVSTYMCFYRYIRPWILKSLGVKTQQLTATLAKTFSFAPSLTYFLQVKVESEAGKLMAFPDPGGGSGDFVNLKNVTGFLELPHDKSTFSPGETFPYFPFRNF